MNDDIRPVLFVLAIVLCWFAMTWVDAVEHRAAPPTCLSGRPPVASNDGTYTCVDEPIR